jgi:hypothetical protein
MSISKENLEIRNRILGFEQRIEEMHLAFQKYSKGIEAKKPDWERLQQDMLQFSKRKIYDFVLSKQMDRVLYKFQNRKAIWLRWIEEIQQSPKDKGKDPLPLQSEGKNSTGGR